MNGDIVLLSIIVFTSLVALYALFTGLRYSYAGKWFTENGKSLEATFKNHGMTFENVSRYTSTAKFRVHANSPVRQYADNLGRDALTTIYLEPHHQLDLIKLIKQKKTTQFLIYLANLAPVQEKNIKPLL